MGQWCENGCGQKIVGRSTKKYCSGACRQSAYEKRVKKAEEAKLYMFTFEEQQIYDQIYRAVDNGQTMQLFKERITKTPRVQWDALLVAVRDVVVDAVYAFNNRKMEEFPF